MKNLLTLLALVAALGFGVVACDGNKSEPTKPEEAAGKTGDAMEEAGKKLEEGADDATKKLEEAGSEAKEALEDATD